MVVEVDLNHIELFAGCGGLSLGLERAGFELLLANELSPMAAETFSYNFLNEDLERLAQTNEMPVRTRWISSQYESVSRRLRENPFEYPDLEHGVSDLDATTSSLKGNLLVGNIVHLNDFLERNQTVANEIKAAFGHGEVDLVSGGPPCQSFSLAGLRRRDCEKNTLPWEFARFVNIVRPKFVILENVTGILRAFKEEGQSYHAWFEVAKVFAGMDYVPLCLHINAKLVGIAQNRPRFIMLGVRYDIYKKLHGSLNESEKKLLEPSAEFLQKILEGNTPEYGDLNYFDVQKEYDLSLFESSFLNELVNKSLVTVKDAIDDLRFNNKKPKKSEYIRHINELFTVSLNNKHAIQNHEPRNNGLHVRRRFRIYQVLQKCSKEAQQEILAILKQGSDSISEKIWEELKKYDFLFDDGIERRFQYKNELIEHLKKHPTKKRTQKALDEKMPAPAALSIPDDACHYHKEELRTLTVREMARIQSFPDNFVYRSKVTTGGQMRRYEVPQYTQVGNAVPPLLGLALGNVIKNLLDRLR